MASSDHPLRAALPLACAACTFTGLGNYDVETCPSPAGASTTVQQVGDLSSSVLTFANIDGASPVAGFPSQGSAGSCAQAVGTSGYIESTCSFFSDQAPQQPWVVPMGGGYGAAAVVTAPPCTQGALAFQYIGPSAGGSMTGACPTGTALPSLAPLASDGSTALVTWYETTYASRSDPIQSCNGAMAQPLVAAVVTGATTASPALGKSITLSSTGIGVRAAAMVAVPDQSQVLVAAPDGTDARIWLLDPTLSTSTSAELAALSGARAVGMGLAGDGSGDIAVVAEIECSPQVIELTVGTIAGGFSAGTVVAPIGTDAAVEPTVAWVASEGDWIVGWISAGGGAHALAQRVDPRGNLVGGVIDPSVPATAASVLSDGSLFAYVPGATSFVNASLGCAE